MAWNPWQALAARPEIDFFIRPLPRRFGGAMCAPLGGGRWVVLIDPSLRRVDRRAALAHELVHIENGGGAWAAFSCRDENRVNRTVALRLVPPDELAAFLDRRATVGQVLVHQVAEEFDVPDWVAEIAMGQHREAGT